jgi:hypothetical protein
MEFGECGETALPTSGIQFAQFAVTPVVSVAKILKRHYPDAAEKDI